MKFVLRLALVGSCLAATLSAQTLVHHWRFGEGDGGPSNGSGVTTTTDSVGALTLTAGGTVTYTNSTAGTASTLAATFDATGYFSGAKDASLTPTSSFILEGWVYLNGTPAGTKYLIYNGNASSTGIGLMLSNSNVVVQEGGRNTWGATTLNLNQWNYVALVYDSGAVKMFVNSDTSPSFQDTQIFNAYSGISETFSVGSGYAGSFDELRVSTFTSGTFNTSMLSYSAISAVPEPSTYAALAGFAALGLVVWRRRQARA